MIIHVFVINILASPIILLNFNLFNYMYYLIIYNFLSFMFILIYVSTETKSIHSNQYVSRPFESMIDTGTLNHVCKREKKNQVMTIIKVECEEWRGDDSNNIS